jgi:enolase-phosphatase E1
MIKTILLDIEGTVTPIDFVHKTLFPYAKSKLAEFVGANIGDLQNEIAELKSEYKRDFQDQIYGRKLIDSEPETIVAYLEFLIDVDRKSTPLKAIQGHIWRAGYESGELSSRVFDDVPRAFERWIIDGRTIAIFSSGSVLAQRMIFKYSNAGDLTSSISAYFDTNTGKKTESASYTSIARELGRKPSETLFISDVIAELDAARDAGCLTLLAIREGNGVVRQPIQHDAIASFSDLKF